MGYERLAESMSAIEKMAEAIVDSEMFGCKRKGQGMVIALHCFTTGTNLLDYQRRNSLIMGRPSIPYDAMLAAFHEHGGKSRKISRTPELAAIELERDGQKQEFSLTWEDAKKESFPYEGKEADIVADLAAGKSPRMKAKYATPRSRSVMLWARVVSDAIRAMAPEVNFGSYTAEEIADIQDEESAAKKVQPVQIPKQEVASVQSPSVVSAEKLTTTQEQNKPEAIESDTSANRRAINIQTYNDSPKCTPEQDKEVRALLEQQKQKDETSVRRFIHKLKLSGRGKIVEMTESEAATFVSETKAGRFVEWMANEGALPDITPF